MGLVLALSGAAAPAASAPFEEARFVFAWKGIPLGTVTLTHAPATGRFTYTSRHVHTRGAHVGERVREVVLRLDAAGHVIEPGGDSGGAPGDSGGASVPQSWWLWRGPPAPGCVTGREELSGREGPHCVRSVQEGRVEGTMFGQPFTARYDARGRLSGLDVGESRFTALAPGTRLRPPLVGPEGREIGVENGRSQRRAGFMAAC